MNEQDISKAVEAVLGLDSMRITGKDMSVGAIRTR